MKSGAHDIPRVALGSAVRSLGNAQRRVHHGRLAHKNKVTGEMGNRTRTIELASGNAEPQNGEP